MNLAEQNKKKYKNQKLAYDYNGELMEQNIQKQPKKVPM